MSNCDQPKTAMEPFSTADALSPFKTDAWRKLTPKERLARSWAMRSRLRNPEAVHDAKLFPKP
jgi:hypothetical protein